MFGDCMIFCPTVAYGHFYFVSVDYDLIMSDTGQFFSAAAVAAALAATAAAAVAAAAAAAAAPENLDCVRRRNFSPMWWPKFYVAVWWSKYWPKMVKFLRYFGP